MTATPYALHNSILTQLNLSPEGMTFAQIYDRMKADRREFGLDFIRKVTVTVFQLLGENLISCDDIFAEPGNGSVREREVLYKIAHRGKIHLLGLVLLSANSEKIADQGKANSLRIDSLRVSNEGVSKRNLCSAISPSRTHGVRVANGAAESISNLTDSQISKIADGYPSAIVKGGEGTAPALSLPPSQISVVTESVERVMAEANRIAVSNRELCDCGRSVTKVCACGKEVCSAHWYDADGNHTIDDSKGMCGGCVSAVQLQTWGESRNGIAGQL